MALPKVSTATYTLKIPSSGKEVTYRPFLVKEEKQLLMAMESNDTKVMAKAMSNIVSACTEEEIDMDDLAPFDLEYFFLNLRAKSIGDVIKLQMRRPENVNCCKDSNEEDFCEIEIPVEKVNVDTSKMVDSNLKITDDIGVKLKYPRFDQVQGMATDANELKAEDIFKMIINCIDHISQGDEIYKAKDHTKKELNDFIESLNSEQFMGIRNFFDGMPRLRHDISWECPNCKKNEKITLEGLESFFG